MNGTQRSSVMTALLAAYEHGILAGGAYNGEEQAEQDKLMLNRLRHAVENAGFEMVETIPAKKEAA